MEKYAFLHSMSGGLGGAASLAVTYPLVTVVTKMQVRSSDKTGNKSMIDTLMRTIQSEGGWRSLYSGMGTAVFANMVGQAVYYYWYSLLRRRALEKLPESNGLNLVVGFCAGCVTATCTNPLWVVTTQMQTQRESESGQRLSTFSVLNRIWRDKGWRGFFSGLGPSLFLCVNPAIQYMAFEYLTSQRKLALSKTAKDSAKVVLSAWTLFWCGATSKALATLATYPQQTVKTRQQAYLKNAKDTEAASLGWIALCWYIMKKEGVSSLFRGLESKILQSVLTAALLFVIQDRLVRWMMKLFVQNPEITS